MTEEKEILSRKDFCVGQELFYVPQDRRSSPQLLTVITIGRKYISLLSGHRISLNELESRNVELKNYGYTGSFYFSEEEYIRKLKHAEVLSEIREICSNRNVKDSTDNLMKIVDILLEMEQ